MKKIDKKKNVRTYHSILHQEVSCNRGTPLVETNTPPSFLPLCTLKVLRACHDGYITLSPIRRESYKVVGIDSGGYIREVCERTNRRKIRKGFNTVLCEPC